MPYHERKDKIEITILIFAQVIKYKTVAQKEKMHLPKCEFASKA